MHDHDRERPRLRQGRGHGEGHRDLQAGRPLPLFLQRVLRADLPEDPPRPLAVSIYLIPAHNKKGKRLALPALAGNHEEDTIEDHGHDLCVVRGPGGEGHPGDEGRRAG